MMFLIFKLAPLTVYVFSSRSRFSFDNNILATYCQQGGVECKVYLRGPASNNVYGIVHEVSDRLYGGSLSLQLNSPRLRDDEATAYNCIQIIYHTTVTNRYNENYINQGKMF